MVAGASEVRLPDRGGNPAAVARGDCLRMAVDVLPSGKLGREFLAGYAGGKELPFLAGADRCRRNGMRPVAVLRNGISKRKAALPSCEAESDAGEVRDNGKYRKLLGQYLFRLYIIGCFASFFIIAEQKNHSKEQPLIERLQEIRDGKYPVEKTHSPTGE